MDIADAIALEIDPGAPGPTSLYNVASRLLEVAAEALDTLVDVGLDGCPARAYVSPGLPAFDCAQLTVHVGPIAEEITSPLSPNTATGQRHKFGRINHVDFVVTVARCLTPWQPPEPPLPVNEDADAQQLDADVWAIWEMFYWKAKQNELLQGDLCKIVRMQAAHPTDPSGGFGGWVLTVQLQIDGYNPTDG